MNDFCNYTKLDIMIIDDANVFFANKETKSRNEIDALELNEEQIVGVGPTMY